MASRFASIAEEQILSINEAAVPKKYKTVCLKSLPSLRLTSFNHLTYHLNSCTKKKKHRAAGFPLFIARICRSIVQNTFWIA